MKIKRKLRIGFGLLFLAVVFFGFLSLFFLKQMSQSSKIILKDNYASLKYVREMREILEENDLALTTSEINKFNTALKKEENNITEPGEKEVVTNLRNAFETFKQTSLPIVKQENTRNTILKNLGKIADINLNAIEIKSNKAEDSIRNATIYIGFLMAFTFIILFSLVFNLVGFFEEPFKQLTEGLRNIANKIPTATLDYDKNDELGDLYSAFNKLTLTINKFQKECDEKILIENSKAETVIKYSDNPIIVLNGYEEIISINAAAERIFGVNKNVVIGKKSSVLPAIDNFLRETSDIKTIDKNVKINNLNYKTYKESIVLPTDHISSLQEGEITVTEKTVEKIIVLKRNDD